MSQSENQQYSDEEILQMLRDCKEEHGICSPRVFDSMESVCSSSLVMRRFGGWSDAKDQAGIDENLRKSETGRKRKYSDEKILSDIRDCYERETDEFEGEKCTVEKMNAQDDLVAASVASERFGSWLKAKEEAGIEADERVTNSRPRSYSDEDYLELLQECEQKYGRVSQRLFDKKDEFPSAAAVRKRFGKWSTAKEKAGINSVGSGYTDEELLEMLRECKEKYGSVSASTFASKKEFCAPETVQRRFDGWNNAKEEAGVK